MTNSLQEIYQNKLVIPLIDLKRDVDLLTQIQIRLQDLGLYTYGATDPDGLWGPKIEQGIEKFCDAVHLNNFETELFGPSFAEALIETETLPSPERPDKQEETKNELAKAVAKEGANQGVTDRNQLCYIMATIQHETAHTYLPIVEYGGWRRPYAPYYGRGYIQLTNKFNYEKYSEKLGQDFVSAPDKVLEPAISLFIVIDGLKNGVFTGKKLSDYILGDHVDFLNVRRSVSGIDKAHLIAGYARNWQKTTLF